MPGWTSETGLRIIKNRFLIGNPMTLDQLRILFEHGAVSAVQVRYLPIARGWVVELHPKTGKVELLERQRGGIRAFKTVDAVVSTLASVQIRQFSIDTRDFR
jgi:hypothetical protein